ncbi:MAG: hypothetical protein ACOYD7_06405 [Raoultibacter sp.]|jgi:hypothetical protein
MLEMQITPATIILLVVIIGLVALAIRRLTRRGLCDCKDCAGSETGACQGCSAVDKMLADMDKNLANKTTP